MDKTNKMRSHPLEHLPMILVSGQARSGTTILTHALGSHPSVHSNQRESNYIRDVADLIQANLSNPSRVNQMTESGRYFVDTFRTALYHVLFPPGQLNKEMKPAFVSTFSSLSAQSADRLFELFPKLFISNIVRNGIEVVASRIKHSKIGRFSFKEHCFAWADAMAMAKWGEANPGFVIFRHEDLIDQESTKDAFARFFDLAGLIDSEKPAEFVHENRVSTNSGDDHRLNGRNERWREWSKTELDQFELVCGDAMDYFGYEIPWK